MSARRTSASTVFLAHPRATSATVPGTGGSTTGEEGKGAGGALTIRTLPVAVAHRPGRRSEGGRVRPAGRRKPATPTPVEETNAMMNRDVE